MSFQLKLGSSGTIGGALAGDGNVLVDHIVSCLFQACRGNWGRGPKTASGRGSDFFIFVPISYPWNTH